MATNTGHIDYNEGAAPSTPAASKVRLYAKTDGLLYSKDDAGAETLVSGGTGGGSVATDAIWDAKGDLAGGTGANSAAKLTVGTNGSVLVAASGEATGLKWGFPGFHGCRAYNSTTQSISNGADSALTMDSENFDTDAFHSTASNTSRFTIPSGFDGYYLIEGGTFPAGFASTKEAYISVWKNGTAMWRAEKTAGASGIDTIHVSTILQLAATDYIEFYGFNGDTASRNFGHASAAYVQTWGSLTLLGV